MASMVLGVPELVAKMHELPDKLRNQGTRKAMAAATRPIVQTTKALVPVRTGLLRQSIASKILKGKTGDYIGLIGARRFKATKKHPKNRFKVTKTVQRRAAKLHINVSGGDGSVSPSRYAHLVELGTKRSRAEPFLLPGLERAAAQAEQAIQDVLTQFIEQEAGK